MTKSEAFLTQAASDFPVFALLLQQDRDQVPSCHVCHYLQMAVEKLAKAALQRTGGDPGYTHEAFTRLRPHLKRRDVARKLGYADFSAFREFLDRSAGLFERIEALHPDVPKNIEGPNVEYPWEARDDRQVFVWHAPVGYGFPVLKELQNTRDGAQMVSIIRLQIERFGSVFPG
jgi:hypothetical protein